MASSRWHSLVVDAQGRESLRPDVRAIRRGRSSGEAHEQIEREIRREIAAALGRSARKVSDALAALATAARDVTATVDADERRRRIMRFNLLRQDAIRARHYLLIHREAAGFRRNAVLESMYPIPPAISVDDVMELPRIHSAEASPRRAERAGTS